MLTIFTILKPFTDDHVHRIQVNALRSWQRLPGQPEILVFGDKEGVAETCAELGIKHIPGIQSHPDGFELASDAFTKAWQHGKYDLMCYCNADIVLPPTFTDVVNSVDCADWLGIGQRWNWLEESVYPITFTVGWWQELERRARSAGSYHSPNGCDYFVHRRGRFDPLPTWVCGSWFWDNSLLNLALKSGVVVCDLTAVVFAIHQNHSYNFDGGLQGIAQSQMSADNYATLNGDSVKSINDAHIKLLPAW